MRVSINLPGWARASSLTEGRTTRIIIGMHTVYTTTITNAARQRGISVSVIDAKMPVFILKYKGRSVRCHNALTDRIGTVSFMLAQDKRLAHNFLAHYGFPTPRQILFEDLPAAKAFLRQNSAVVVKPCREWGGRGISVAIKDERELERAIARAQRFEGDVIIEECLEGTDYRLIFVEERFVAAIRREPACITGNGKNSVRTLILRQNLKMRHLEDGCRIPLDAETRRCLASFGLTYASVPPAGAKAQVRFNSNYHTGGAVSEVTETVSEELVRQARKVVRLFQIPVMGVDFLVNPQTGRHWIIELSPDLAISPPEGERVAKHFLDYLFPETTAAQPEKQLPKRNIRPTAQKPIGKHLTKPKKTVNRQTKGTGKK